MITMQEAIQLRDMIEEDDREEVIIHYTSLDSSDYTFTRVNGVDSIFAEDELKSQWLSTDKLALGNFTYMTREI